MTALRRKLLRDVVALRGPLAAVALVVTCALATVVTTRTAYESLIVSRSLYYASQRFGDVFAHLVRAPESVAASLAEIPGVAAVETRLVHDVSVDLEGASGPVAVRIVSLPEHGSPRLNGVHLRSGRWPAADRREEVIVSEAFASANELRAGDGLRARLNGRLQTLRIVGVGLAPEFVYEVGAGEMLPDPKRFGVLWMGRRALAAAFDREGAFDDVVIALALGASERDVIARVDAVLDRWGGTGAYGRAEHVSHRFLDDEIAQNRVTGVVIPTAFLFVAAFLVHALLHRVVATQREAIATLEAFGYEARTIAAHYVALGLVPVVAGTLPGVLLGLGLAHALHDLYVEFYRFPVFRFEMSAFTFALGLGAALAAGLSGALGSVRAVMRLPPAEAMRPPIPPRYRRSLAERIGGLSRHLGIAGRMVLRQISRRPGRTALATTGTALAVALLVIGRFFLDSVDALADLQLREIQRDDATVFFHEAAGKASAFELASLDGVRRVEGFRAAPVRLRAAHRSKRTTLLAVGSDTELRRLVDVAGLRIGVPETGLVIGRRLAELLALAPGDEVRVESLEGKRWRRDARISGVVDEYMGLAVYTSPGAIAQLLGEGPAISGAWLRVDETASRGLDAALARRPAVAGVVWRRRALERFEETIARSMAVFQLVLVGFACVVAGAIVYNGARIALEERASELATLRVLGHTQREAASILLGEQAIPTLLALPLGIALGLWASTLIVEAYQWELFRLPIVIRSRTLVFAVGVVLASALGSAVLVARRLGAIDLAAALKAPE